MFSRPFQCALAIIAAFSFSACGGLIAPGREEDGGSTSDAARDGETSDAPLDLCTASSCETPPADYCIDAKTARSYVTRGTCSSGNCGYSYTDFDCIYGCIQTTCAPPP